jgi:hypothetical protein
MLQPELLLTRALWPRRQALDALACRRRVLLSGTPIQVRAQLSGVRDE